MTKTPQEYEAIIEKYENYIRYLETWLPTIHLENGDGTYTTYLNDEKGRTLREELAKLKK